MLSKHWKSRASLLMTLALLEPISLAAFAQTPSTQLPTQCTEMEIQKHIQQVSNGEPTTFNALVACQSKAVPALIKALDTQDENARIIIIAALGQIGSSATPALPFLKKLLAQSTSSDVESMIIYALKQMGKDSVVVLISDLKDENNDVRSQAASALGNIGKDAVPALITALKDKDNDVRLSAINALGQIGTEAKDAVPALITALKDKDNDVRSQAASALGNIGSSAKDAVPVLISTLKDKDNDVRFIAINALGQIGTEAKDAVPALITALKDKDNDVRFSAANVLGQIGIEAKGSVAELSKVFLNQNEEIEVRHRAAVALENIASTEAMSILNTNMEIANFLRLKVLKQVERERKVRRCLTCFAVRAVRAETYDYVNAKPPVICKVQGIRAVLRWKCLSVQRIKSNGTRIPSR